MKKIIDKRLYMYWLLNKFIQPVRNYFKNKSKIF